MKRSISITASLLVLLAACSPQTGTPQAFTPLSSHAGTLRVAYSKNADPWIWTEGEGARQLADSVNVMEVVISSDGQVVAFQRDDTGELFAVNADGSNLHPLVSTDFLPENAAVWAFDFAPDSHNVFFTLKLAGNAFQPFYDLYRADADAAGSLPDLVLGPGQGGIASFSPDGQWMSLYHPGGLDLARVDGSEARKLFSYPEGYEPATFGPEIVWMEDSSGFALFHTADPMVDPSLGGLWFVPVSGDPVERTIINNTWGIPSPDGRRVGFSSVGSQNEVRIVEADGTNMLYRRMENSTFLGWAPDSEHFLVTVEEEQGGVVYTRPYLCRLGDEPVLLTDTSAAHPVRWIAAGEFLFASWGELRLQRIGEASLQLDDQIYNLFDYALFTP
jgi:hypothetical protein